MLGAIIGDISGSRFEWENLKSKEFELLTYRCHPTDDSNMTLAVAQAMVVCPPVAAQAEYIRFAEQADKSKYYCQHQTIFRNVAQQVTTLNRSMIH